MTEETLQDAVLRAICSLVGDDPQASIKTGILVSDLGLRHFELYRAVISLTEAGYLDYLGAGPTVRLTDAGVYFCRTNFLGLEHPPDG